MAKNIAVKQKRLPPQRTCVSCRRVMDKRTLVRLVHTPEGKIEIDASGKMSGRGAYLCSNYQCWHSAVGSQRLARALKCNISPDSLNAIKDYAEKLNPEVLATSKN